NAIFKGDDVRIDGTLAQAAWPAASGNTLTFHFCPGCGTQVFGQSSARMHLKTVRFGVIDQPHDLAPQMVIWTDDAPDWAVFDPAL
ncbi:GFA family protein, partial [Streptomyces acidiscabies]|uniref:GFA family protein n=1 Tax=Streptomyces acidiscabies TaxID=42234 RepID=UPI0038F607F5